MTELELRVFDVAWVEAYDSEILRIGPYVAPWVVGQVHVGSTAVPGLAARPVIDILLETDGAVDLGRMSAALAQAGYPTHLSDSLARHRRLYRRIDPEGVGFHVHAAPLGSAYAQDMIRFRDALRADRALAEAYQALKRSLIARDSRDLAGYFDAKTAFIADALARS